MTDWLEIRRGQAPLIVSMPHTGAEIPPDIEEQLVSPWLARKDADWHIEKLYAFAGDLDATLVRTPFSRTVIDVNRDPSGASLYPGQTTTGLCPTETFDGEPLYPKGSNPDADEIERRRDLYFTPYHEGLAAEIERLRAAHEAVVLYEAHSIRSVVPRLFDGVLPQFNIGTNGGTTCDRNLAKAVFEAVAEHMVVVDGRFRGGWTTRHYGRPIKGVHAIQMELAMRGYLDEPEEVELGTWPAPYDPPRAEPLRQVLEDVLCQCLAFADGN